ncbi:hypothetical protein AbraCBS73388_001581 [Aspergillus brasiliensis]|uniref:FAD-binding domain-containing protein n=1 Tax=Aspergillus brasiliensis TaxID=319629 RepID=A0A9W5YYB1_9EURO|nr:hypothetical protein AbraCBS73388_001581 [Aspergillus brasiliensis]
MVCLLGDAGHPMMPHQSQGACMAIEDAAALGIIFSKAHFKGDVADALSIYQEVRLPRATKVQAASAKAAYNINERIGFSSNTDIATYKVEDEKKKLTIEEMNGDIEEVIATRRGLPYTGKFIRGLPVGLKLGNGTVVGEEEPSSFQPRI